MDMDKSEFKLENGDADAEISIFEICKSVLKKLWLLVLVAAVAGSFAFITARNNVTHSYVTDYKNYFYTHDNLIEAKDGSLTSSASTMEPHSIMRIYYYVVNDNSILQRVIDSANLDLTVNDVKSMISVEFDDKDNIATVYVTGSNPEIVYSIAVNLNNIARDEIMGKIENCEIETLVPATDPVLHTSGKSPVKSAVLASVLAFILTAVIIAFIEIVEDKVKSPSELEERSGIVVLGSIPEGKKLSGRKA